MNARPRQQPGAQLKREPVPWGQNTPGTFPEGKALRNQSYFSTVTHCVIRQLLIMPGPEARTLLVSSRADWPRIKHKHPRIPSNCTCYETRWTTVKGRFGVHKPHSPELEARESVRSDINQGWAANAAHREPGQCQPWPLPVCAGGRVGGAWGSGKEQKPNYEGHRSV